MTPYQPRPLMFLGLERIRGYRLKRYSIRFEDQTIEEARFADGMRMAAMALPDPAQTAERPGVGFLILHQGRTMDYLILGWWDRENELPTRVFLRTETGWRPAREGESFCIWDLRVMSAERDAYVRAFLSGRQDESAYLGDVMNGTV